MSNQFDPIDSLIIELKSNAGFINKLLFPRISLVIGGVGILIAAFVLLFR